MILNYEPPKIEFVCGESRYAFLTGGDPLIFEHGQIQLNRFTANPLDGSAMNLWLRVYGPEGLQYAPLIGVASQSRLERSANGLRYIGTALGIRYNVRFTAREGGWLWQVELLGRGERADVVYGQDVGMAVRGALLENELYVAQYLGHTILQSEHGYTVCSRQNMKQAGANPYLQLGMAEGRAVGYSTDGMQFFGQQYKRTNAPKALSSDLCNANYQFECTYIALQTEARVLNTPCHFSFYGFFKPHREKAITALEYQAEIAALLRFDSKEAFTPVSAAPRKAVFGAPYASPAMEAGLLDKLYPHKQLEERENGALLSFFDSTHTHVVTQAKELLVERPHAGIITTFLNTEAVNNDLLTTTCCMYGQFSGQTVVGNTSKHKLLSAPRGLLNVMKNSGLRLWVKLGGQYRLLTLPALFETGLNHCRWYYLVEGDLLTITTFAAVHSTDLTVTFSSRENKAYECLFTAQLVMGTHEFEQPVEWEQNGDVTTLRPAPGSPILAAYPSLCYQLHLPAGSKVSDDRVFFENDAPQNGTLLTIRPTSASCFTLNIRGILEQPPKAAPAAFDFEAEKAEALRCYTSLLAGFSLEKPGCAQAEVLTETAYWYAHNAMVHFAVPHGLEQPGGAAWGTRDICQGPFEFFLSTQHFSLLRSILSHIFSHQSGVTGEWPQWFMFDRYTDEMDSCHGDVIFWPLKCLGDYLRATGDTNFLQQALPFTHSSRSASLLEHVKLALCSIEQRLLPGTALISYAGGDWDDTLQPASEELKCCLVSSWTQALAFQVLEQLSEVLPHDCKALADRCQSLAQALRDAFNEHLVIDGVIAGFVYRLPDGSFRPMLHPQDEDTGIHYRLLPMTRSIIAGLSSEALAEQSMQLVEEKLHCPDGVRLMDHPAPYSGGESRLFLRAEQAANVGREISLQYTHAHIRYIEALCRLGSGEQAWNALFEINPLDLHNVVKNALPRQRNLYFSSSEGVFADRWIYDREFDRLKAGTVAVKGGWRLYSSGPGIYFHQLMENVLGLCVTPAFVQIDPVLPQSLDGLRLHLNLQGVPYTFVYHIGGNQNTGVAVTQAGRALAGKALANPYRKGGLRIPHSQIGPEQELHIYLN